MKSNISNEERIKRLKLNCSLLVDGKAKYFHHGHTYVEIGGLKWATMNVGATSETDYGLYFQWGDTQGYTADQVGIGEGQKAFKSTDYKWTEDDAVRANWGGDWHMPTREEFLHLGQAVNSEWVTNYNGSGNNGFLCTDKNDSSKTLFFPAAGFVGNGNMCRVGNIGYVWSGSLFSDDVNGAWGFGFYNGGTSWDYASSRYYGFSIRGVAS